MVYETKTISTKHEPAVTGAKVFAVKTTTRESTKADSKWNPDTRTSEPIPEIDQVWVEDSPYTEVLYATFHPSEHGGGVVKFEPYATDLWNQSDIDAMRVMLDQIEESGVLKSE